ncbi:DnaT-like ssDNA-binding protein [Methylobacterium sp. J-070]|uniref:DnaT-like ssDNA-binding protein n=1 Tax=Methylobacterium sp. J-070 TaxID=2836650 RepID=UPI001FBBAADC|nr:DnaT-like ssDNA-binding protein [Methylobacterium sp. J-070]MCJ2048537.1 hypothetical protein [Methylobacterium sp. J-070]
MTKWDASLPSIASAAALGASQKELEEALKHATQFLDTLPFKGLKASKSQALSWPRIGIVDKDGLPVRGIPVEIKEATSLVAGFILAKIPFGPSSLAHVFVLIGHLIDQPDRIARESVTWH